MYEIERRYYWLCENLTEDELNYLEYRNKDDP